MNRALPRLEPGALIGTTHRQSRYRGASARTRRLVGRTHDARRRATPQGRNSALGIGCEWLDSAFDGVAALLVVALRRYDLQALFLAKGPGQEAANAVRLPSRRSLQFLICSSARPLQEFQDRRSLTSVAGA